MLMYGIVNSKCKTHRWLAKWNLKMDSEAKERKLRKGLIGDNIECEAVPLTFPLDGGKGGEEVRQAPMAYVPNLVEKVVQLLDQNDK